MNPGTLAQNVDIMFLLFVPRTRRLSSSMTRNDDPRGGYVPVSELPTSPLQQGAIAIIFILAALSVLVWATRIYYRCNKKQVGLDDWLVTAATMFLIGLVVPNYYYMSHPHPHFNGHNLHSKVFRYGYTGFHTDDIPDDLDMEPVLFYNWIMQVLYNHILALVKSSLLFFLLRLGGHRRSIRRPIYALNTLNIALMIAIFLTVILQTIPIRAFCDQSVAPRHQIDRPVFYISTAIITTVTDFLVLLIPFWVFVGLKMRLAAKLGLIVVFLADGV
ncbi:hypothetical protein HYE67_006479 [Fusarium culmorum]|uniref:Rhodopsin domain-containing protein n=1 Tax=Fusarium culmorum TaxID=5516 RepID=A0A2T4H1J4_FUSCU|nr:hypothetical protein FCULG_00007457 [Fusarium culmorum]QPC64248.1 hypothetical protein HYE67_006479 [Fusarium culmorum]